MRVAVYDKNPGAGTSQWGLALSWRIGCFLHKLFGKLDDYYAASSWDEAIAWLLTQPKPLTSVQYWGHGSPATIWLAGVAAGADMWLKLKPKMTTASIVWFRVCSAFQGRPGQVFAKRLAHGLGCTIAAHTRIIGVFQGGLHTLKPGATPSWPDEEGELPGKLAKLGLRGGNNSIFCLRANVPEGW
jgi:hypothetical protein